MWARPRLLEYSRGHDGLNDGVTRVWSGNRTDRIWLESIRGRPSAWTASVPLAMANSHHQRRTPLNVHLAVFSVTARYVWRSRWFRAIGCDRLSERRKRGQLAFPALAIANTD
jgi:hypothetical protein